MIRLITKIKISIGRIKTLLPLKETVFSAKIQKRFDICKWGFPNWGVQNFNI
jgi:hypothetical protein